MTAGPVLGVDGCPRGWVAALVDAGDTGRVSWLLAADIGALLAVDVAAAGIDIPIGLPEDGPRACDVWARRLLSPRGSTVFPAPVRSVIGAQTYAEACERSRSRRRDGAAISLQTWHILPKIAQVDAALPVTLEDRVVEVHPEASFLRMAGAPLPPKRMADGRAARLAALATWRPVRRRRRRRRPPAWRPARRRARRLGRELVGGAVRTGRSRGAAARRAAARPARPVDAYRGLDVSDEQYFAER
jgi:predicted RNase H-like nuclease